MARTKRKSVTRISPKGARRVVCIFLLGLAYLWLPGTADSSAAAIVGIRDSPATLFGPGPQFAIADFDGDVHPDLASIDAMVDGSGVTDYWIQLQLSAAGPQSIRLAGPAGGLLIEARDVNGDDAVDLVLATAWLRQPVAILLNNGHVGFLRVQPTAFPGAFAGSRADWHRASEQLADVLGLPSQAPSGSCHKVGGLLRGPSPTNRPLFSGFGFLANSCPISHAGRAPPSEVAYLLSIN